MAFPRIESIEIHEYAFEQKDLGTDAGGFNVVYQPGATLKRKGYVIRMTTDTGVSGEYAFRRQIEVSTIPTFWHFLKGQNALEREGIYDVLKRSLRQVARIGIAPVDNALWDIAGKYLGCPLSVLLGGYRKSIPCYASTYHGDYNGGLDSPEAYADFAVRCRELGYPGFKIHGWGEGRVDREIATISAVRESVGAGMDLMLDPACELRTYADALKVGRACDEAGFLWYEDPFRDGGISHFAHRQLRHSIRTPLLLTEHVRGLEAHADFAVADATDFVRADTGYDGITASMKIAHACEALGVDVEFHLTGPEVRQCIAATRNTNYYEMALVHPRIPCFTPPELYVDYQDTLTAVDSSGHVDVPQGNGLGAEINWDWVKAHTTSVVRYE